MTLPLDWRTQLARWAQAQPGRPFVWGETDCAALVRQGLELVFGHDLWPETPYWHSAREAKKTHKTTGGMVAALQRLGAQQTTVNFARSGDVVAFPEPEEKVGGTALGLWVDDRCLLSSDRGVVAVRRQDLPPDAAVYSLWGVPVHG